MLDLKMLEKLRSWRDRPKVYRTKPARKLPRMYQEEVRAIVTVSAAGDNVILAAQNKYEIDVISVTVQPASSVTVTLKEKNFFVSQGWQLFPLQFAVLAGKIIDRNHDLILNLSAAVSVAVEVRWIPYFKREYRPEWGLGNGAK